MRILHVAASYLPATRYGGTIVSVHGLCKALAANGHDVHVFTTSVDGPEDSTVPHGVPVELDGVRVWYFRSPRLRRIYFSPDLGRALREQVRSFEVVHTHAIYLWPLWAAARQAHHDGVPHVISLRGMLEKELLEQKSPLWKAAIIGFIERPRIEQAAALHVTSAREREQAAAFGFAFPPFFEIPNGVDAGTSENGAADPAIRQTIARSPYVLFLGRINWKKGLDRLLRALPDAPSARLVLAGADDEQYRQTLEALARSIGVLDRIEFAGEVSGVNKAALLRHADVVILPSYSENFGNVVLEAMAAGRPVIVTPEVGLATVIHDTRAGVVVEGNPRSIATAIESLMADHARREEMGANGRAAAERHFTWAAVAGQMESMYAAISRPC